MTTSYYEDLVLERYPQAYRHPQTGHVIAPTAVGEYKLGSSWMTAWFFIERSDRLAAENERAMLALADERFVKKVEPTAWQEGNEIRVQSLDAVPGYRVLGRNWTEVRQLIELYDVKEEKAGIA